MAREFRIGQGFDAHRLRRGHKLVLGGVQIPHTAGLIGHSDADVLVHALINALLGAMGEGDIGQHFPDDDPRYKGICSLKLLTQVVRLIRKKGFVLVNADVTIVAQRPKLAPYYGSMKNNLAKPFKVPKTKINIKAATTEKLGWLGEGKGMAATAVVLLQKR